MADLLTKPRQLAPTVGHSASGARIQAGSAFAGIGDTVLCAADGGAAMEALKDKETPVLKRRLFWSLGFLLALFVIVMPKTPVAKAVTIAS